MVQVPADPAALPSSLSRPGFNHTPPCWLGPRSPQKQTQKQYSHLSAPSSVTQDKRGEEVNPGQKGREVPVWTRMGHQVFLGQESHPCFAVGGGLPPRRAACSGARWGSAAGSPASVLQADRDRFWPRSCLPRASRKCRQWYGAGSLCSCRGSYTRGGRPSHQAGANLCSSESTAEGSQALGGPLSTVVTERERSFRHATPSLGRCLDSESQINGAEPERRAGPAIQVLLMENRPFPCLKTDCCGCQCHLESGSLWGPRSLY